MSTLAPDALEQLWHDFHARVPRAELGGIVGDARHQAEHHTYHVSREDQSHDGGYSVEAGRNQGGPSDLAAAIDFTLPSDLMKSMTAALVAAARAGDPRLANVAELCGTLDGISTYPWDVVHNCSEGVGTWDPSHLWHIHVSFLRDTVNVYAAVRGVVDVMLGVPLDPRKFPGVRRYRYGDQGPAVLRIQRALKRLGWYAGPLDGDFGPGTQHAVRAYKHAKGWRVDGKVGARMWARVVVLDAASKKAAAADRAPRSYSALVKPAPHGGHA